MIERHMPDVKVVGVDRGGVGTKHRKCFFHGNQIINCCSYCCDLQFWYITDFFFEYRSIRIDTHDATSHKDQSQGLVASCVPTFMLSLSLAEF